MNYQRIACWGDSQTFGARTYGCYPLYLVQALDARTRYAWQALNYSSSGHTARDTWFRLAHELPALTDVHQACLLIGTNDVGNRTPPELFEEYCRQILSALRIKGLKVVYCGEIPPIWPDGHAFFASSTKDGRELYNAALRRCVEAAPNARFVAFPGLTPECYVDPVHFNEDGNRVVAEAFAAAISAY
jgi:lysophospholipase L1-like esterase